MRNPSDTYRQFLNRFHGTSSTLLVPHSQAKRVSSGAKMTCQHSATVRRKRPDELNADGAGRWAGRSSLILTACATRNANEIHQKCNNLNQLKMATSWGQIHQQFKQSELTVVIYHFPRKWELTVQFQKNKQLKENAIADWIALTAVSDWRLSLLRITIKSSGQDTSRTVSIVSSSYPWGKGGGKSGRQLGSSWLARSRPTNKKLRFIGFRGKISNTTLRSFTYHHVNM